MNRKVISLTAILAATAATYAQTPVKTSAGAAANPLAASQAKIYKMLSATVVAAAEKMPEENYSFQPTPDIRTFGQLVGHLADAQYYFCSTAAGEKPAGGGNEKSKTSKADLVEALKEAVAYCSKVYDGMTDTKGTETTKMMNMDMPKLTILSANVAHDYEHYGNMATYMRIKGIVPPSSEKAPAPSTK